MIYTYANKVRLVNVHILPKYWEHIRSFPSQFWMKTPAAISMAFSLRHKCICSGSDWSWTTPRRSVHRAWPMLPASREQKMKALKNIRLILDLKIRNTDFCRLILLAMGMNSKIIERVASNAHFSAREKSFISSTWVPIFQMYYSSCESIWIFDDYER